MVFQPEILKGQGAVVVELALGGGVGGVAVVHALGHIQAQAGQGDIVGVGGRAHGEQEPAAGDKLLHFHGFGGFHLAHLAEIVALGGGLGLALLLLVPGRVAVDGVKLAVLTRKILVVQVQPVVLRQHAGQHLIVVNLIVGDFGVGEHHRHGVVPGLLALGGVNGDFGTFSSFITSILALGSALWVRMAVYWASEIVWNVGILPNGGYKTTSLRGLYLSAPYLHDGGVAVRAGSLKVAANNSFTVVDPQWVRVDRHLSVKAYLLMLLAACVPWSIVNSWLSCESKPS